MWFFNVFEFQLILLHYCLLSLKIH
jgi:hypothetical protein